MLRYVCVALLLAVSADAMASGKRKPLLMSVHLETDGTEGPQFSFPIPVPGSDTPRHFRKSAEVTDREVEWFYLFPADNGNGYGAAFKLNSVGTNRLEYVSSSNQGRHLLVAVHPAVSSFVLIDKVISDGIVVVWEGLTETHIAQLREYHQERTPAPTPGAEAAEGAPGTKEKPKLQLFRRQGS
jgi:hypothetical protein